MTPEGRVKALVKKRMKEVFGSGMYQFMPVQNGMGAPGLDFYFCIGGLFVAIETKAPGRMLTPRQQVTATSVVHAGGLVFVVDDNESLTRAIANIALKAKCNS